MTNSSLWYVDQQTLGGKNFSEFVRGQGKTAPPWYLPCTGLPGPKLDIGTFENLSEGTACVAKATCAREVVQKESRGGTAGPCCEGSRGM